MIQRILNPVINLTNSGKVGSCTICKKNTATQACNCHKTMTYLCDSCIPTHIRGDKSEIHMFIHVDSVDKAPLSPSATQSSAANDSLFKLKFELNIDKLDVFSLRSRFLAFVSMLEELLRCKHRKSS